MDGDICATRLEMSMGMGTIGIPWVPWEWE